VDQAQTYAIDVSIDGSFHGLDDGLPKGTVSADSNYIVTALLEEPELILDATCRKNPAIAPKQSCLTQVNGAVPSTSECLIDITLYGRSSLFDHVGSFFQDHDMHLQDPESCKHVVPYQNPHKLPRRDGRVIMTSELEKKGVSILFIENQRGADLLDELTSQQDLAEAAQPPSIRSKLQRSPLLAYRHINVYTDQNFRHQLQALTFMLQREQGWAWDGSRADIWELCEDGTDP
jgi:SWI/SNF-related matrix-associated actin-dependent regulator of chromatin subfamily A3